MSLVLDFGIYVAAALSNKKMEIFKLIGMWVFSKCLFHLIAAFSPHTLLTFDCIFGIINVWYLPTGSFRGMFSIPISCYLVKKQHEIYLQGRLYLLHGFDIYLLLCPKGIQRFLRYSRLDVGTWFWHLIML